MYSCARCGKETDEVIIPCFGRYAEQEICPPCLRELEKSKLYRAGAAFDYRMLLALEMPALLFHALRKKLKGGKV